MTPSGVRMPARTSASSPVAAVSISYPAPRSVVSSARRISGSSSTTRMCALTRSPEVRARSSRRPCGRIQPRAAPRSPPRSPVRSRDPVRCPGSARGPARTARRSAPALLRPGPGRGRRPGRRPRRQLLSRELDRRIRRERERVVDQVHEHVLDLGAVDLDRVEVRGQRDRDALRASAELAERLADQRLDRPQLGFWLGRSELEAREVEEVRDQAIEAPRLGVDRGEQARAVLVAQLEVGALEPVGRGADRGQRASAGRG